MTQRITKAVIPAAGLGTRFLPATKAMPKEMLPVVDKPAIQYVVEEAVAAGLDDVLMIIGRNKNALANHFDRVAELEHTLEEKGDGAKLSKVQESSDLADVHFVRQGDPKGLGHAVLRARKHVGDQSFAVLLGDDLIDARDPLLTRMLDEHDRREAPASSRSSRSTPPRSTSTAPRRSSRPTTPTSCASPGLVEKPAADVAPSNYAVIGRYVLKPEVFDILEHTQPGKGGEIQLTDALMEMAGDVEGTGGVYGVVFRGRRYDTGDKLDYIKAVVQLAADRDDLGPDLRPWLIEYVAGFDRT